MAELFSWEALAALAALTSLEIVLGIDNVVFIAVLAERLPAPRQAPARRLGLALAMLTRIALLFAITWTLSLTTPLFQMLGHVVSWRDVILLGGGLFLIIKATHEIFAQMETHDPHQPGVKAVSFWGVITQIALLDMIFSLDSVITAVGMARQLWVMVVAIVLAVAIMLIFAGVVSRFIQRHPSFRVLALAFLLLVGVMLTAEGMGQHIDRGYIYFAMAFSLSVELLNLKIQAKRARAAQAAG
ncbi:MAG: TerC family protein [Desulfarculaceae bacterium]|nr:TerC family protein [Desulfarculaceae bacterium]MCF8098198.1 TerC family protein [Desulfarculaceae bacterium]MCF8123184.1 TerC family protein [Desulfarculaceae bacterium]